MQHDIGQILRQHITTYVTPYYRVLLLAYSGGMDSTVLLDTLTAIRDNNNIHHSDCMLTIRAVHIHHGLNCCADQWAEHCAKECKLRNITFNVIHITLNETPEGIEASARKARYQALEAALKKGEILLTAQHQNDQVETLMLALKRGSGPAGLASMAIDAPFKQHRLVRPFLELSKEKLEIYAYSHKLCWIEDNNNKNLRFDRNFLRLSVLPILKQRWPHFANAATRSAQLCAEQEQLIDELLADTLADITAPDKSLYLTKLIKMSNNKRAALLRRWLANLGVRMPTREQLSRLWQEVVLSRNDSIAQLKIDKKITIRRFHNRLYIAPCLPPRHNKMAFYWPLENEKLTLPSGFGTIFRYLTKTISALPEKPLTTESCSNNSLEKKWRDNLSINTYAIDFISPISIVRAPMPEEKVSIRFYPIPNRNLLYIIGRKHGRTLKKIWQEKNVPPWWRGRIPMLFYNNQLIAALGVFVTQEGTVCQLNEQWQLFWQIDTNYINPFSS